ncbi:MAG: phosphotransferase [Anaerolineales bacterium]|nr:phosphotransferase [Anaerolineales bacterium]
MDQDILRRFHDSILQEAMRRYGIPKDSIQPIDTFESFIYSFERDGKGYILRIGHSFRKSEALIQGEVDWINHLARGGVSVARAVPSQNNKLVEIIEDGQGGQFLATAFVRARGQNPWEAGWSTERYETYGELLGKMHALAVDYQPAQPDWKRPEWNAESLNFIESYLPAAETAAHQKYRSLLRHIHTLPKDRQSYGLVHQDAHQNNFFMDEDGSITLFDFDDCAYSWFINDIAIVLFYISMDAEEFGYPSTAAFTKEFMLHFLRGYRRAYAIEPAWLKEIPAFLKLRELELYAVVHRDFDIAGIDHNSLENFVRTPGFDVDNSGHMWIANFMHNRKSRIEQDLPFIEFDFESLE